MGHRRLGLLFLIAGVPLVTAGILRAIRMSLPPGVAGDAGGISAPPASRVREPRRDPRSRCDEGPPSAEGQAEWWRTSQPRALGALAMAALARRSDQELVSELHSRLLDELYTPTAFTGMTRVEQNMFLALTMHGEVMNGGFHQYFADSSGDCALRTAEALVEIGDGAPAALFQRALAKFPKNAPAEDRAERVAQMEALGGELTAWEEIDRDYYEVGLPDRVLARYSRAHLEAFTPPVPVDAGVRR